MKIFCVGRNYVDHAKELNNPVPDSPVIFMKPPSAILKKQILFYPSFTKNLHFEGELVIRICRNGKKIQEKFADRYYDECTIGFDMTARDLQSELKSKGLPWELAKGFDSAAPLGKFIPFQSFVEGGSCFEIFKNQERVQVGHISDMIFNLNQLISYISSYIILQKGDLIFTGTPAGVGPVQIGDKLEGRVNDEVLTTCVIR